MAENLIGRKTELSALRNLIDSEKSEFIAALENFWNSWAVIRNDIKLIVCGSATSWIINNLIHSRGGLHNRLTHHLMLEPFCLNHLRQIKQTLGILGVQTLTCSWRSSTTSTKGAQIDLLIDRKDETINVCEIKYAKDKFEIDKEYECKLTNKPNALAEETGTNKSLMLTSISTSGVILRTVIFCAFLFGLKPHPRPLSEGEGGREEWGYENSM